PIYPFLDQHAPELLASFGNTLEAVGRAVPILNWKMSPTSFPISGQELFFFVSVLSILLYVAVSLLTCRKPFDFDRMLHRGKYNLEHHTAADAEPTGNPGFLRWKTLLGIT
ncbi:hypothetical protein ACQRE0_22415, partial [Victivallis vadensis]